MNKVPNQDIGSAKNKMFKMETIKKKRHKIPA